MAIKVGINGFGRIGRNVLRTALARFQSRIRGRKRLNRSENSRSSSRSTTSFLATCLTKFLPGLTVFRLMEKRSRFSKKKTQPLCHGNP